VKRRAALAGAFLAMLVGAWQLHRNPGGSDSDREAPSTRPGTVSIDDAEREHLGLATAAIAPGRSDGELEIYGRVLDPMPLVDASLARAAARASLEPARREYERVRRLSRGEQNASQRELEAAEALWRRAELDLQAAQARLTAAFGLELASRGDFEALTAGLASRRSALARVELPAGVAAPGLVGSLRLEVATGGRRDLEAKLVGEAPSTDPMVQGRAWLALIEREPPAPGTALEGTLALPDLAASGLVVPEDAVVRQDGVAFVYVEGEHNVFQRRAVSLEHPLSGAWLTSGGVAAGDAVVVRGAQELLSAERSAVYGGE
jgi:hypothetical protein